jgi:hypothetical protein
LTLGPFGTLAGGIPSFVTQAGPAASTMGAMLLALLALTTLVLVVARRRA